MCDAFFIFYFFSIFFSLILEELVFVHNLVLQISKLVRWVFLWVRNTLKKFLADSLRTKYWANLHFLIVYNAISSSIYWKISCVKYFVLFFTLILHLYPILDIRFELLQVNVLAAILKWIYTLNVSTHKIGKVISL